MRMMAKTLKAAGLCVMGLATTALGWQGPALGPSSPGCSSSVIRYGLGMLPAVAERLAGKADVISPEETAATAPTCSPTSTNG